MRANIQQPSVEIWNSSSKKEIQERNDLEEK